MKKVYTIFAIVTLIFASNSLIIAQTFEWVHRSNASILAAGSAIATDEHGNSYTCGSFFGTCNFGGIKLNAWGRDAYLVKYDHDGKVLWAKKAGGQADDFANALAIDKEGNCYVAGSFAFTIYFGTDSLVSIGQHDIFLAKYSSKGDLLWRKSAGGYYEDHAMAVSLDKFGNCYIAGYFRDTMRFDYDKMITGKGIGSYNMFLAKYDSKGNVDWAKPIAGSNYGTFNDGLAIASSPEGMTYITGYYQNEAAFDSKNFTNHGTYALFVAKYDADGKMKWVKSSGSDATSVVGKAIAVDKKGNCYVTGTYTTKALFDSVLVISRNLGYPDVFLTKYNPEGNVIWARTSEGFGAKFPYSITIDAEGNPFVIGTYRDTAIFDQMILSALGSETIFVVKYSASGKALWAKQTGRYGPVLGKALSVDGSGNIYMTGNFSDTIDFGKERLIALPKTQDVFFAKLSPRSNVKEKMLTELPSSDFAFLSCELNPKSMIATVKYSIPKSTFVLLEVYNMTGAVTESFIEGQRNAGTYEVKLSMKKNNDAGEYYCRLQAGAEKQTRKMTGSK